MLEAIKSPNCEAIESTSPYMHKVKYESLLSYILFQMNAYKANPNIVNITPPIAPSTVFLGLTSGISLFLPNLRPKAKASVSESQAVINTIQIR